MMMKLYLQKFKIFRVYKQSFIKCFTFYDFVYLKKNKSTYLLPKQQNTSKWEQIWENEINIEGMISYGEII